MMRNISSRTSSVFITSGSRIGTILATAALATLTAALPSPAEAGSFGFGEPKVVNGNYQTAERDSWVPDIAADGQTWVVVWYTSDDILGQGIYDTDVYSARSTDGGDTWAAPTLVNHNTLTHNGDDIGCRIETEGGTWICSWFSWSNLNGELGGEGDILYSRSLDGGVTWELDRSLNTNAATDSGYDLLPVLRPAGDGVWLAIWTSRENLTGTIGTDFDVLFARSEDDGLTWSAPQVLNSSAETSTSGAFDYIFTDAATDRSGNWVATWSSKDDLAGTIGGDYDILYALSSDNGKTWSETRALNTNAATDAGSDGRSISISTIGPCVRTDRAGNWVTIWSSLDSLGGSIGDDADILFARSTDNGATWSDPLPLNSNAADDLEGTPGTDTDPWLDTDSSGNWVAVWLTTAFSGPTYSDYDMAVSKSTDHGMTWTPIAPLNYTATADTAAFENVPRLVSDGSGGWMTVWMATFPQHGNDILFDEVVAASFDIEQPASPPFWNKEIAGIILNIILGYQILDLNGDGEIDIADLLLTSAQGAQEGRASDIQH